jgi:predicted small secreted protein
LQLLAVQSIQPFNRAKEQVMWKQVLLILSALSLTVLAGCNTISGLGDDIERGGEKVQGAADKAKK